MKQHKWIGLTKADIQYLTMTNTKIEVIHNDDENEVSYTHELVNTRNLVKAAEKLLREKNHGTT